MAVIIGDYNRKGGVGKTSSLINLAAALALKGKRILTIDGDSQMNLTQFFFEGDEKIIRNGKARDEVETLYQVLDEDLNIYNAIRTKKFSARRKWRNKFRRISCSLDVILGSRDMDYYDCDNVEILKSKLTAISKNYDYIFIDFPPAHNLLTMMHLVACDYVIVPLHLAKNSSTHGYEDVIERCREVRVDYGNKNLRVLGLFYINTQLYKEDQRLLYDASMEEETKNAMRLFQTTIRHDYAAMQICESEGEPLSICCGNSEITKNYATLAKEIDDRVKRERGI